MKDDTGVNRFELTDEEKKLVLAALQRMLVRGRYRQVDGAKLVDFQQLVAKFSNQRVVRVSRKITTLMFSVTGSDLSNRQSVNPSSLGIMIGYVSTMRRNETDKPIGTSSISLP